MLPSLFTIVRGECCVPLYKFYTLHHNFPIPVNHVCLLIDRTVQMPSVGGCCWLTLTESRLVVVKRDKFTCTLISKAKTQRPLSSEVQIENNEQTNIWGLYQVVNLYRNLIAHRNFIHWEPLMSNYC